VALCDIKSILFSLNPFLPDPLIYGHARMIILNQPEMLRELNSPIMLAAGFFDGVHIGHQCVLKDTIAHARETGAEAWALTFNRHPLAVLAPSKAPPLLMTLEERLEHLEKLGLDGVLMLTFTRKLALQSPEHFVHWLCGEPGRQLPNGKLSEIRCGANWRFGSRAAGTPELLAKYGEIYGFRVIIVPYAFYQGKEVSSTRIRFAIQVGDLKDATAMLGRPYSMRGEVMRGRGLGASLGFATANIQPQSDILPPLGVYATRTLLNGRYYDSLSNFGVCPTVGANRDPILETHLLDYSGGSLYNKHIAIDFLGKIREELRFASTEELVLQIKKDVLVARQILSQLK
jgi:riboflavin kinase / FMN adenylyltransferase